MTERAARKLIPFLNITTSGSYQFQGYIVYQSGYILGQSEWRVFSSHHHTTYTTLQDVLVAIMILVRQEEKR